MERLQMKWRVYIHGNDSDLEWLTTQFQGPDWWIEKSRSEVYVAGRLLELFHDPNEVRAFVAHWLTTLSGAHRLFRGGQQFSAGRVAEVREDGTEIYLISVSDNISLRANADLTITDNEGRTWKSVDHTAALTLAAAQNPAVRDLLGLFGKARTWADWYKVVELFQANCGGEHDFMEQDWIPSELRKRAKLLKHLACDPAAVGLDDARHAAFKQASAKESMTLDDAKDTARTLVELWVRRLFATSVFVTDTTHVG